MLKSPRTFYRVEEPSFHFGLAKMLLRKSLVGLNHIDHIVLILGLCERGSKGKPRVLSVQSNYDPSIRLFCTRGKFPLLSLKKSSKKVEEHVSKFLG